VPFRSLLSFRSFNVGGWMAKEGFLEIGIKTFEKYKF